MKQYKELLQEILDKGVWKEPARENMPRTKSLFGARMEFDLSKGFPLLTTKKMYYKGIITELLWFLKGDTNIKYLVDNGCNIWNQDAYRWYLEFCKRMEEPDDDYLFLDINKNCYRTFTLEEFVDAIKFGYLGEDGEYKLGDLGKVYGYQWRNQNGIDQVKELIEGLNKNPYSRYHIIDAWQKSDFKDMALPPCHLLYQFNCRPCKNGSYQLDLQMYQRSCDTFLGVPFNIASASLLLHIIAKTVGMEVGKFIWIGGDTHIYENHLNQVDIQLKRNTLPLSKLIINKDLNCLKDIERLSLKDICIEDYKSYPAIKAELKTGL